MRTIVIILGGFVLLGLCLLLARWLAQPGPASLATGAKIFLPLWLIVAAINMWIGVTRAGYTVAEELPIFLLILAVPGAPAAFLWWKYG
jgi:hypothetical protein